jgi:hypothetical protein
MLNIKYLKKVGVSLLEISIPEIKLLNGVRV